MAEVTVTYIPAYTFLLLLQYYYMFFKVVIWPISIQCELVIGDGVFRPCFRH